jgi:hypothetical protein
MEVADAAFIQMDVTKVLRVHRRCVLRTVVANDVFIWMVVGRVLKVQPRFVKHMVVAIDANTHQDAINI